MGRKMIPAMLSSSLIMMLPGQSDPPDADIDNHADDNNHADYDNHAEDDDKEDNNRDAKDDTNLDDNRDYNDDDNCDAKDDAKLDENDGLCSWRAAKENCSSQGGFLASIHSQVSQVVQVFVILM